MIGLVIGTRPEAIKLAPVAAALASAGAQVRLFVTGQHPGLDLGDHDLGGFPCAPLGISGRADPHEHVDEVAAALSRHFSNAALDLVLVQGDTSSALGGARAARSAGLPLGHVEAGLRSFDSRFPWPEEDFRIEIDSMADLLFAPTSTAAANLRREQVEGTIHVTGNSGIDALMARPAARDMRRRRPSPRARTRLLVTCHRRENWGDGIASLAQALRTLVREDRVLIDVVLHPNPDVAATMWDLLGGERSIRMTAPLGHDAMIAAMGAAHLILSDSGGIQEEAPALGIPLLVLRERTERPEAIECGNAMLVGVDSERIVAAVRRFIADSALREWMSVPRFPFGDGAAAPRIAALALSALDSGISDNKRANQRIA